MPAWLVTLPIERIEVLAPVYIAAAVIVAGLLVPVAGLRGAVPVRAAWSLLAAGVGALLGLLAVWITVDVQDLFGAPASTVIRAGVAGAGAGIGVAVTNLVASRWWRRAVAIVAIPVVVAAGGLIVNRDVAYFPRLGDVFGFSGVSALPKVTAKGGSAKGVWTPPIDMPAVGTVGTASIPGTVSRFSARRAWVYLPPAARVQHPPALPVVVAFAGQPGGPSDVFLAGGLQATMDAVAAKHKGVAPIVVVPDQLGSYTANPMCLNSRLGQVATYVTVDVRDWILHHLPVSSARRHWTLAGFSQGATCAIQFAVQDPGLFGSFIAVSPELGPFAKSVANTIRVGFDGKRAAYEAAQPIAVMRRVQHYERTRAVYSIGANDRRYRTAFAQLRDASRAAGMHVDATVLPGLAHNWNTGSAGLRDGMQRLTGWWELP